MEPDHPLSWLLKGVFKLAARKSQSGQAFGLGRLSPHLKRFPGDSSSLARYTSSAPATSK